MFYKTKPVPEQYQRNAVIYARFSSSKQKEISIEGQLRVGYDFAGKHNLNVIDVYIDRATTATNDKRSDFQRMLDDTKKQTFAWIIVYEFNRFARNRFDSAIYKKELAMIGIKVLSATQDNESIILESLYEAMDEAYSRNLSKVTKRGMRETALKGLWTGGHTPIGYKVENRQLTICEKEAQAIRYAVQEIENNVDPKYICDELYKQGFRARTGKKITTSTLRVILSNTALIGKRKYQDLEIPCPAILTEEQFINANAIMNRTKKKIGRKPQVDFFTLGGKLFCGECGSPMTGDSGTSRNGDKHYYYTCATRKNSKSCTKKSEKKDEIEIIICKETIANVLTDENISKIAKIVVDKQEEERNNSERKSIEKALVDIEREYDKLADALIKSPTDAIAKRIEKRSLELEEQKDSLEIELARIKIVESIKLTTEEVEAYLKQFKQGDLNDKEFRYKLIKMLVNCVYLYDDKIVIYYNLKDNKTIHYADVLKDVEQVKKNTSCVFEENKPRGAKKKRHELNSCLFFLPSCCGSRQRRT